MTRAFGIIAGGVRTGEAGAPAAVLEEKIKNREKTQKSSKSFENMEYPLIFRHPRNEMTFFDLYGLDFL